MGRRKDPLWDYAKEESNGFRCNFCERYFSGGIPRIKAHLSGVRGHGIEICACVPENVQSAILAVIEVPAKKAKIQATSADPAYNKALPPSSLHMPNDVWKNATANKYEKDQRAVHAKLAKFLMLNNIPLEVVDSQSFLDLIKGVAQCGRDYKQPSSVNLEIEFLPIIEKEVKEYVKDVKKSWASAGCTLMLDIGWNSISVYAYSLRGAIFFNSYKILKNQKIDVDVKNIVASAVEDIGVQHLLQFITNDVSAFCSAKELLDSKYPKIYKIQCVANTLHLLLEDIYQKLEWVRMAIDAAKSIVEYMYGDASIQFLMKQNTKNTELKRPCLGKFASNYPMLQSVLHNKDGLRRLVDSLEWREFSCGKVEATKITNIITGKEFWSQVSEVLKVLEPIVRVLCLVEGDGATSGYLFGAMKKAKEEIIQRCSKNDTKIILELFEEKKKGIVHPIHAAAAFLNPAYMCCENFEESSEITEMKDGIEFMMKALVADEERKHFVSQMQRYRNKVSDLFTETAKEMLETSHPCVWWESCGDPLPVLRKYALQILSQPCKLIASEVVELKKNNWTDCKTLTNLKLKEKFKILQAKFLEPIDLGKCCQLPDYVDHDHSWTNEQKELSQIKSTDLTTNQEIQSINDKVPLVGWSTKIKDFNTQICGTRDVNGTNPNSLLTNGLSVGEDSNVPDHLPSQPLQLNFDTQPIDVYGKITDSFLTIEMSCWGDSNVDHFLPSLPQQQNYDPEATECELRLWG